MTATATLTGTERRTQACRQPTLGTVCRLGPQTGAANGLGLVWNISIGGVSMLLSDRLERGQELAGVLATSNDDFSLPVTLRVALVTKLATGDYLVGTQFDRPISSDQMRHFLPEAVA